MINLKSELINSDETSVIQVAEITKEACQGFFNSRKIKNSKENFLTPEGSIPISSWLTLPEDFWKEIFSHLSPNEATRSTRTCKFFNKLKNNDAVLKKQLQKIGYGNEKLAGNFTFNNKECYLVVRVPEGVTSPEDFMKKINTCKENMQGLREFIGEICDYFRNILASEKEYKEYEYQHRFYSYDPYAYAKCLVKIKLSIHYVKYLIDDSACLDINTTNPKFKPQNFIKIIDSLETPSIIAMQQYLIKQGLKTEAEINNLAEAEKINNSSYLVKR